MNKVIFALAMLTIVAGAATIIISAPKDNRFFIPGFVAFVAGIAVALVFL